MAPELPAPAVPPAAAKDGCQEGERAVAAPRTEPPAGGDGADDGSAGNGGGGAAAGADETKKDAAGADAYVKGAGGSGESGAPAAAASTAANEDATADSGRQESDRPRKRRKADHSSAEAPPPHGAAAEAKVDASAAAPPTETTDASVPPAPAADANNTKDAKDVKGAKEPAPKTAAGAAPAVVADSPTKPHPPAVAAAASNCPAGDAQWASLLASNATFAADGRRPPLAGSSVAHREALAGGQSPAAVVVACSDSRVSPELLFARGLGELFVIRTAGNTAAYASTVASVEYAVHNLGAPLVVVLGHTGCGAVAAAVATAADAGALAGQPSALASFVKSALVAPVRAVQGRGGVADEDFVAACEAENVAIAVRSLVTTSKWMCKARAEGKVKVVGAIYNVAAGTVKEV